jgi:general secretion pathway protein J
MKSQCGFTLVELTIAMTLLALMTTILYGAFYLSHRAIEKSQARTEESQRMRSVEEILAGYVRSAYPYRSSLREPSLLFSGQEDNLAFVSALSLGMGGRGMSQITISWDGNGNGPGRLTLEEKIPLRLEDQEAGEGYRSSIILGEGVWNFRIEYLDGDQEQWLNQWDGKEKKSLPRAIRLSHRGRDGKEIQWVFPVMISVLAP